MAVGLPGAMGGVQVVSGLQEKEAQAGDVTCVRGELEHVSPPSSPGWLVQG